MKPPWLDCAWCGKAAVPADIDPYGRPPEGASPITCMRCTTRVQYGEAKKLKSRWFTCAGRGMAESATETGMSRCPTAVLPVLCERCIEIAFVRMTLIRHGLALTYGNPKSNRDTGHARRMEQHCARVATVIAAGECEGGDENVG